MSKPNSARTESAVFGSTVTSGPIRPILPMMRPTIRIPAAYPKAKWAPPGSGMSISPRKYPRARPMPRDTGLISVIPLAESPSHFEISRSFIVGPTTRRRSPISTTRSGIASMSASARLTREIFAFHRLSRISSSSAIVLPTRAGVDRVMRRKSKKRRSERSE